MSARAESSIGGCGIAGVTLPQPLKRPTPPENVDPESSELFAAIERALPE